MGLGAPGGKPAGSARRQAGGGGLSGAGAVGAEAWRCRPWVGLTAQVSALPRGPGVMVSPAGSVSLWSTRGQHGTADGVGCCSGSPPAGSPRPSQTSRLPLLASWSIPPTPQLWIQALPAHSRQLFGDRLGLPWLRAPGSSGGDEGCLLPERVQGEGSGACGDPWVQPLLVHLPCLLRVR